jgi:EmrB/QacA subfamily drug resistance transporter
MAFIDGSVVSVALPVVQKTLNASAVQMQWVNNAYLLFLSAFVLVGGSLGDRVGRKKVFIFGILMFTLASVACGLSPNSLWLIGARAVQGLGAALLVPSSLAIIGATFAEEDRGRAIGTWAGASAIVTALAPLLGGWLVDSVSWRAIFLLNVPVALIAVGISIRFMPETRDTEEQGRLDLLGAGLVALGLAGITYGLSPDRYHTLSLLVGAGLVALFVTHEARASNPMVPLSLFRNLNFSGTNALTLLLYFALSGAFFYIPFYLIQVQGFSATAAGAAFLPFTIFMGGGSRFAGGLVARYGARTPLIVGPLIVAVGLVVCAFAEPDRSYWAVLFPAVLIMGVGMTVSVAPLTTAVMASVPPSKVGVASGINNAVSRLAGLLAVAVLGVLVLQGFTSHLMPWVTTHHADYIRPQIDKLMAISLPSTLPTQELEGARTAIRDAFTSAIHAAMLVAAGLAALGALCSALLIRKKVVPVS